MGGVQTYGWCQNMGACKHTGGVQTYGGIQTYRGTSKHGVKSVASSATHRGHTNVQGGV